MKCRWCGKEFDTKYGNERYCSDECRHEAHLASCKEYSLIHREKIRAYARQWYRKKKEAELEEIRFNMQSQKENPFWQTFLKSLDREDRRANQRLEYYYSRGIK